MWLPRSGDGRRLKILRMSYPGSKISVRFSTALPAAAARPSSHACLDQAFGSAFGDATVHETQRTEFVTSVSGGVSITGGNLSGAVA